MQAASKAVAQFLDYIINKSVAQLLRQKLDGAAFLLFPIVEVGKHRKKQC
ncbi:hypothetical protein ACYATP_08085 [Lactobacillaceae bacterium Melli_B4]